MSAVARRPGGLGTAARHLSQTDNADNFLLMLTPDQVLSSLRAKHPTQASSTDLQEGTAAAEAIYQQSRSRPVGQPTPTFTPHDVKHAISWSSRNSSPGPSGLCYQHLHDLLRCTTGPLADSTVLLLT